MAKYLVRLEVRYAVEAENEQEATDTALQLLSEDDAEALSVERIHTERYWSRDEEKSPPTFQEHLNDEYPE